MKQIPLCQECGKPKAAHYDGEFCYSDSVGLVAKYHWNPRPVRCPTPWEAKQLMIADAQGATVLHLGGSHPNFDPYELELLIQRIVDAVNAWEA